MNESFKTDVTGAEFDLISLTGKEAIVLTMANMVTVPYGPDHIFFFPDLVDRLSPVMSKRKIKKALRGLKQKDLVSEFVNEGGRPCKDFLYSINISLMEEQAAIAQKKYDRYRQYLEI